MSNKKHIQTFFVIIFWLIIWEIVDRAINNSILLTGPLEVLVRIFSLVRDAGFWMSILASCLRIILGLFLGVLVGILLAVLSHAYKAVKLLLEPPLAFIKATPVAAIVVLFLIWWHSDVLAIAISFLVVMPQIYVSVLEGLGNTDIKLIEMARVYELSYANRIKYIYIPAVRPFLEGALKVAVSFAWKSGVAAEVIGTPKFSVGSEIYMSKIYLDTTGVLAWTVVIILLSSLFEKGIIALTKLGRTDLANKKNEAVFNNLDALSQALKEGDAFFTGESRDIRLKLDGISKAFGDKTVLDNYSREYVSGNRYDYDWPSGAGKTTLLRIIAGLDDCDEGTVSFSKKAKLSYIFQEDRLLEKESALKNVSLVCGDKNKASRVLGSLLDSSLLNKPVKELSGGERRRVEIARALAVNSDILLADEPFNGLDEKNREVVNDLLKEYAKGRIVIVASHLGMYML